MFRYIFGVFYVRILLQRWTVLQASHKLRTGTLRFSYFSAPVMSFGILPKCHSSLGQTKVSASFSWILVKPLVEELILPSGLLAFPAGGTQTRPPGPPQATMMASS